MLPSDSSIYIPLNNALLSRLKIYVFPLMLLLLTRVGLLLIGLSAPHLFSAREVEGAWRVAAMPAWLEMWARWDSGFYLEIAKYGYTYNPTEQTSAAFFPLYPLLIKLLSFMTTDPVLAGFIVSNTCFYIALIILYKLTLMDFSKVVANRTLIYLALFPTSFFFSAVYTESIFLMLILLAVYAGRKQRWELAGIAGLLASSSRIVGVVVWGVLALEWMSQHGWTLSTCWKASAWRNLWCGLKTDGLNFLAICMIPCGLLSYVLFLNHYFADPLAFMTVQAAWQRESLGMLAILARDIEGFIYGLKHQEFFYQVILDVPVLLISLVMSVFVWRRLGAGYALYVLLGLIVPASSSTQSISRYVLVLFPLFMMLAQWGQNRRFHGVLVVVFSTLSTVFFALFVNWYFVA